MNLEIRNRGGDFHVQRVAQPAVWECGKTPEEALGKWLVTHGTDHGIYLTNAQSVTSPTPSPSNTEPQNAASKR